MLNDTCTRFVLRWLFLLTLFAVVPGGRAGESSTASNPLWRKIVMIGASASAGFTVSEPLGGTNTVQLRLSRHVDAALMSPHEPVLNLASAFFFLQPEASGQAQMTRALQEQPSVLLGVDFLFWFCYGKGADDTERLRRFEHGLKLLEPVNCPLVLGDLPDVSAAVNKMLSPDQIPSSNALAAANTRLKSWAKDRPHVRLVPLSDLVSAAMRNGSYSLRGVPLAAGRTRTLLQDDNLHPSVMGSAVIALVMLDSLRQHSDFADSKIEWDPAAIAGSVRESARANTPGKSALPATAPP